jgi:CreA protein
MNRPFTRFVARPAAIGLLLCLSACGGASEVGAVDTVFKFIGLTKLWTPTTTEVAGVTCYVSRAKTGGIKVGWA